MPLSSLTPGHVAALARVASVLADARGDWWIIAGAAVALHGGHTHMVDDIDVLIGQPDIGLIAGLPGVRLKNAGGSDRFQSDFHATTDVGDISVEWMAGFRVAVDGVWQPVMPRSRLPFAIGEATVYLPDRTDLIAMLRSFGRPKDLARIAILKG